MQGDCAGSLGREWDTIVGVVGKTQMATIVLNHLTMNAPIISSVGDELRNGQVVPGAGATELGEPHRRVWRGPPLSIVKLYCHVVFVLVTTPNRT